MSRIWAALPLIEDPLDDNYPQPPARACWWSHPLNPGPDGERLILRTDQTNDEQAPRIGCWEWFDGCDTQLIYGVDVFRVICGWKNGISQIDVLALDVPTRSPAWQNVTPPGDWVCRHDGTYSIPRDSFVTVPFLSAPAPRMAR